MAEGLLADLMTACFHWPLWIKRGGRRDGGTGDGQKMKKAVMNEKRESK